MTKSLEQLSAQLSHELSQTYGLAVDQKTKQSVLRKLIEHERMIQTKSYSELCQWLINEMSVNETYFFRDQVLTQCFIKYLHQWTKSENRDLTIWSMGSSSGEEAYTFAMLLDDYGVFSLAPAKIRILGFDISTRVLEQARSGRYQEISLRATPSYYLTKYFKQEGEFYFLDDKIRDSVQFVHFNLAKDLFNQSLSADLVVKNGVPDIILCRNILIYFKKRLALNIVGQFSQILQPGGYFITSPQEAFLYQMPPFSSQSKETSFILQKSEPKLGFPKTSFRETKKEESDSLVLAEESLRTDALENQTLEISPTSQNLRPQDRDSDFEPILRTLTDQASWERVFLHEAVLKFQKQEYQQADEILVRIVERDPTCYCAYLVQAYLSQKQGVWEKSFESIRKSRFVRPDTVLEHYLLSQYFLNAHKHEKAYQSANRALSLYQDSEISPLEFQLLEWLGIRISDLLPAFYPAQKKGETFHV